MYFEDAGGEEAIRSEDNDSGYNDIFSSYNEQLYLIDISGGIGELQQRENITEEVVDRVSVAKGQLKHGTSMNCGIINSHKICTKHQTKAHLRGHSNAIQQWITDSQIKFICYFCQHIIFRNPRKAKLVLYYI